MKYYYVGYVSDLASAEQLMTGLRRSCAVVHSEHCIGDWMADNHLKLNEEKTQIIWLGTRQQLNKVTARALTLPNATVEFSTTVKALGVVLDSQLTMADHIAALSRSCFFHIRQLRSIRQSLTTDAMKTLVYAFVSSRIDDCNSILAGVSGQLLQRLQSVQNAAARPSLEPGDPIA